MTKFYKSEKTFQKNAKICRDDYAKKYSNKVYIGMAVCKGRGDDINTKLNIYSPIPTSFLHVTATAALYIIWLRSSVWPVQNIACLSRDPVTSSVRNYFKGQIQTGRS